MRISPHSTRWLPSLLCLTTQVALAATPPAEVPATISGTATSSASAGTARPASDIPPALAANIRAALKQRVPKLVVLELHGTQIPGLYEVLSPDGITYTDASADHVIMGELLDTRTRANLTQQDWTAFNRIDFTSLPLALAIKSTRGNGAREIAVFADPKCPYCQELEAELAKLDNITVYTFLYPLEDVHPGATARAREIWCAANREAAWNNWMRERQAPAAGECASDPIKELATLGDKLHIQTTPTIFFRSGLRSSGLPATRDFEHLLDTESAARAATASQDPQPSSS